MERKAYCHQCGQEQDTARWFDELQAMDGKGYDSFSAVCDRGNCAEPQRVGPYVKWFLGEVREYEERQRRLVGIVGDYNFNPTQRVDALYSIRDVRTTFSVFSNNSNLDVVGHNSHRSPDEQRTFFGRFSDSQLKEIIKSYFDRGGHRFSEHARSLAKDILYERAMSSGKEVEQPKKKSLLEWLFFGD